MILWKLKKVLEKCWNLIKSDAGLGVPFIYIIFCFVFYIYVQLYMFWKMFCMLLPVPVPSSEFDATLTAILVFLVFFFWFYKFILKIIQEYPWAIRIQILLVIWLSLATAFVSYKHIGQLGAFNLFTMAERHLLTITSAPLFYVICIGFGAWIFAIPAPGRQSTNKRLIFLSTITIILAVSFIIVIELWLCPNVILNILNIAQLKHTPSVYEANTLVLELEQIHKLCNSAVHKELRAEFTELHKMLVNMYTDACTLRVEEDASKLLETFAQKNQEHFEAEVSQLNRQPKSSHSVYNYFCKLFDLKI